MSYTKYNDLSLLQVEVENTGQMNEVFSFLFCFVLFTFKGELDMEHQSRAVFDSLDLLVKGSTDIILLTVSQNMSAHFLKMYLSEFDTDIF